MKLAIKETVPHQLLWKKYRENQDSFSQEVLVKQYGHLVEQMANRLSASIPHRIIPREDLIGLGYIGLIEAIKKFDYNKGYQFETYGLWRIKGAMLDGIRKMDWVPRGYRERAKKLNNALRHLEQTLMRVPTEEELSQYLEMPLDEIEQAMSTLSLSTLLSLNEPVNANEDEGKQQFRLDQIADDQSISQDKEMQMTEFRNLMAASIDKLPEKEKTVISLLYYEGLSQVEIAEVMDLTKGRISQIHSKAIVRLRQAFEAKGYNFDSFN
ncbi:FliA/WhiG family RNA polymerase sigma factor [Bacillus sp. BRMEA1]|uniref:sigma-70 family RNA polymerase sigma factor n=1 Tax=Neobacillus endophyticus TaxID=2738405 RepID=UPI0015678930|nr:FliA/WhiG family RNA polymerase sigma factor [Neobacillus endophyticus]NRD79421.1 FliA/WhiG family RNA polymerase sigma factor [Neobacillus endophyticus]